MPPDDIWSRWVLHRRFGNDPAARDMAMESLRPIRDRVLDGARLTAGETLLDAGCGDGLIGFGALERHPDLQVIFTDISESLLAECRAIAADAGVDGRCRFVEADITTLTPIPDDTADAVTVRSVLIYVAAKQAAFDAAFRVLKPGGRLSLFEPISAFAVGSAPGNDTFWGYDAGPIAAITGKIDRLYNQLQPPGDPMRDFDERDLVTFAARAGFRDIAGDFEMRVLHSTPPGHRPEWGQFLSMAPNPKIPSLGEAMEQVLSVDEREAFIAHLRPLVESGAAMRQSACLFLTAHKPG